MQLYKKLFEQTHFNIRLNKVIINNNILNNYMERLYEK